MSKNAIASVLLVLTLLVTSTFMIVNLLKISECQEKHNTNICYLVAVPEEYND